MAIGNSIYRKICTICGYSFIARRSDKTYCSIRCQNKYFNDKAQRLSLKLTTEQRQWLLDKQDEFLSVNAVK